jgi:hypothetical protein
MHQTVGNALRTLLNGEPPQDMTSTKEYVNEALSIAMHVMRAAIHSTFGSSLGSLTFNATRVTLATITPIAPLTAVGKDDLLAGILLPSLIRKTQKTSHPKSEL